MKKRSTDPILVSFIQDLTGTSPEMLNIPAVTEKLQEIAGFFEGVPLTEVRKAVRSITLNKNIPDMLNHIWSFCELNSDYNEKKNLYDKITSEYKESVKNLESEMESLKEEIEYYY